MGAGERVELLVNKEDGGLRLDKYLAMNELINSRNIAQRLIGSGLVYINDKKVKKNQKISPGDRITFELELQKELEALPEELPLDIIYEDDDIVVISKAAGMVTHPAPGHSRGTVVNALLAHTELANTGRPTRPGIVHRLDKDTSGLMVAAKTDQAYYSLIEQLKKGLMKRRYLVLVDGEFKESSGEIKAAIGRSQHDRKIMAATSLYGREATTHFKVIKRYFNLTLLEATLETGRTHQIRVHMRLINHKVIGDPVYGSLRAGRRLGIDRQFLHAYKLEFNQPTSGKRLRFISRLPNELAQVLKILKNIKQDI